MIVLVPVYILAWALNPRRRDEMVALAVALVAPAGVLAYHLTANPGASATGGLPRMQDALLFSTDLMALRGTLVLLWVVAALTAGFLVPVVWRKALVIGATAAPLVLLFAFGAGQSDASVGAIAMPILLAVAPVATLALMPSAAARADARRARDRATPGTVRVVLPAYNEEASIGDLLERIGEVMTAEEQSYVVLVVDDGSSDDTGRIAESYAGRLPVTVVRNERNLGLGGAILRGLKAASGASALGDVVVTLDADLTQDPGYIPRMIASWTAGADIVIASRFRPGARVVGLSPFRRLMTLGARAGLSMVMFVEGARDSCGFRLYDALVLRQAFEVHGDALVSERGFACMVEILGKMRSVARVEEVPFVLHARRSATQAP